MSNYQPYYNFKKSIFDASVSGTPIILLTDTLKMMILTAGYTFSLANDRVRTDVIPASNEVTGTNYTTRGFALTSRTVTLNTSTGVVTFDAADITAAQAGGGFANGRFVVLYKDSGTDSTSPLIAVYDPGLTFGNVSGPLTLQINLNNIFLLT